jgi:hypothetical protein
VLEQQPHRAGMTRFRGLVQSSPARVGRSIVADADEPAILSEQATELVEVASRTCLEKLLNSSHASSLPHENSSRSLSRDRT